MRTAHLAPIFWLLNIAFAWPYTPKGGLGTNSTLPNYRPLSDFDFQSIVSLCCSLHKFMANSNSVTLESCIESRINWTRPLPFWIGQVLRRRVWSCWSGCWRSFPDSVHGRTRVWACAITSKHFGRSVDGITEYYSSLTMLPVIGAGAQQCTYQYPFTTVREFVDFCQKVVNSCISAASQTLLHLLAHTFWRIGCLWISRASRFPCRSQFASRFHRHWSPPANDFPPIWRPLPHACVVRN